MLRSFLRTLLIVVGLLPLLASSGQEYLFAQSGSDCEPVIAAYRTAIQSCRVINSNWTCYGYTLVNADPDTIRFHAPRDRQPIDVFSDVSTNYPQGAALMRLQSAEEGGEVTVILFGGVDLESGERGTFNMSVNNQQLLCSNTRPGMVVHTESGERGVITINGVTIFLASSLLIEQLADDSLLFANLDGDIQLQFGSLGRTLDLEEGYQLLVEMVNDVPVAVQGPVPMSEDRSQVHQWLVESDEGLSQICNPNAPGAACRLADEVIPACGGEIAFGQTLADEIYTPGQECLYTFQAAPGETVSLSMLAEEGSDLDPWLDLRGPTGQQIQFNNNIEQENNNSSLCGVRLALGGGEYTVVARSNRNLSSGRFSLTLQRGAESCEPPVEQCHVMQPLSLRSTPGGLPVSGRAMVEAGSLVEVLSTSNDGAWVEVAVDGRQGWLPARSNLILCNRPTPVVRPTAAPVPTVAPRPPVETPVVRCASPEPIAPADGALFPWYETVTLSWRGTCETAQARTPGDLTSSAGRVGPVLGDVNIGAGNSGWGGDGGLILAAYTPARLAANTEIQYRVEIQFQRDHGQTWTDSHIVADTNLVLPRYLNGCHEGRLLSMDGQYKWTVTAVKPLADGSYEVLSPTSAPRSFGWERRPAVITSSRVVSSSPC
jgi:hypothetical protein